MGKQNNRLSFHQMVDMNGSGINQTGVKQSILAQTAVDQLEDLEKVLEKKQAETVKPPPMYKVILNNDDYTPMEFVIEVLRKFFSCNVERATQLMLTVHYQGKAICGIFTAEIAEMKVVLVNRYAREHEHPLLCTLEKA